jgi:hypothetical protein
LAFDDGGVDDTNKSKFFTKDENEFRRELLLLEFDEVASIFDVVVAEDVAVVVLEFIFV